MNRIVLRAALKILYYIVMAIYHALDLLVVWYNFHVLLTDGTISGVRINNITVNFLFAFSCVCCTIFTPAFWKIYAHYMNFHCHRICDEEYGRLDPAEESANIQISDHELQEDVSLCIEHRRNLVNPNCPPVELIVSVAEMTFKDNIQSGLLFWVSTTYILTQQLSWNTTLFVICKLLAHLKLFICFFTKLFRLGEGEDCVGERNWDFKRYLAVFGCIESAVFEGLTITYLVRALQA
jgi:hypothetical protein